MWRYLEGVIGTKNEQHHIRKIQKVIPQIKRYYVSNKYNKKQEIKQRKY